MVHIHAQRPKQEAEGPLDKIHKLFAKRQLRPAVRNFIDIEGILHLQPKLRKNGGEHRGHRKPCDDYRSGPDSGERQNRQQKKPQSAALSSIPFPTGLSSLSFPAPQRKQAFPQQKQHAHTENSGRKYEGRRLQCPCQKEGGESVCQISPLPSSLLQILEKIIDHDFLEEKRGNIRLCSDGHIHDSRHSG